MILSVKHTVADFEAWKSVFDEHAANRKEHGATGHRLARSLDDPNSLTVLTMFPDRVAAEGFLADASLRQAMSSAGVTSEPIIELVEVTEEVPY
jgi:quinol monooxygenase YgiN